MQLAFILPNDEPRSITHFVGFPDNHGRMFQSAVRVFGAPAFMHRFWDRRAQRDIADGDLVVFATGDEHQPVRQWNGDDQFYDPDPRSLMASPDAPKS